MTEKKPLEERFAQGESVLVKEMPPFYEYELMKVYEDSGEKVEFIKKMEEKGMGFFSRSKNIFSMTLERKKSWVNENGCINYSAEGFTARIYTSKDEGYKERLKVVNSKDKVE